MEKRIENHGSGVNVGDTQIGRQQNTVAPSAESVDVNVDKSTQRVKMNYVYNIGNSYGGNSSSRLHYPPPLAGNLAASYLQTCRTLDIPENMVWSNAFPNFASTIEDDQLKESIELQWQQTSPTLESLNNAVCEYQSRNRKKSKAKRKDGWTGGIEDVPMENVLANLDVELDRAIELCTHGSGIYKQLHRRSLQDIKENLDTFSSWLNALTGDRHRRTVCAAVKQIISAIADGTKVDDTVIGAMARAFDAFHGDLNDYLRMARKGALSRDMVQDTIGIFEAIAGVLVSLLTSENKRLKAAQQTYVDSKIKDMRDRLLTANRTGRRILTPYTAKEVFHKPDVLPGSGHDPNELRIQNVFLFLVSLMPTMPNLSQSRDDPSNPGPPLGISIERLVEYTSYRVSNSTDKLNECMAEAKPDANNKQRLANLTRRREFSIWLKEESESLALLVLGRSEETPLVSPLSYLCARIVKEYASCSNHIVVLSYFCSLHARDGAVSATNLLCHMIGQLLSWDSARSVYAQDPLERNFEKNLKRKDFDTLLSVFVQLIEMLREQKMVIFCLIDSISNMESGKRQLKDTGRLLGKLSDLVNRHRTGSKRRGKDDCMIFKLMVTDWGMSLSADRFFDDQQVVDMFE